MRAPFARADVPSAAHFSDRTRRRSRSGRLHTLTDFHPPAAFAACVDRHERVAIRGVEKQAAVLSIVVMAVMGTVITGAPDQPSATSIPAWFQLSLEIGTSNRTRMVRVVSSATGDR